MIRCALFGFLFIGVVAGHVLKSAEPKAGLLEVVAASGEKTALELEDLRKLPQRELKAKDHRGTEATFSGVLVADILQHCKVPMGKDLRGPALATALRVEAADKYRVVFSLPELDPEWTDKTVLLATSRDGQPLDAEHGPAQIVVSPEKRHSRWVKRVSRFVIIGDEK